MSKIIPFALLLSALLLSSCGIDNTMYNARKYFKSAQARPLNANGKPTPQAVDEYTKAIKKCGIILTNKKDSRIADDALYLMARALYYKGNSAFQAKDQFEALITGFPDSPFVPEAHIYLAKVLRDINQAEGAEDLLEQFILDERFARHHPRALLTLAEFEITDKDYLRAQFWLEKIISGYTKSREYREAFFLFGKNYYVQKDYSASLSEFEKLAGDRKIPKELRLDARYYIALNQYELGDYDKSLKTTQRLLNDEVRPEKLALAKVLKARLLFATGKGEDGVAEIDALSKASPRTAASAEAYYHLGDYQFYQLGDLNQAGTSYNKVKTEFALSEFVEPAQRKTNALNQLKQNRNPDPESNFQQFLDYYTLAAENYLSPFNLPDSALVCYQRLIDARDSIQTKLDTLLIEIELVQAQIDSLSALVVDIAKPEVDTISEADSLFAVDTDVDSVAAVDSMLATVDTTMVGTVPEIDSLITMAAEDVAKIIAGLSPPDAGDVAPDSLDFHAKDIAVEVETIAPPLLETEMSAFDSLASGEDLARETVTAEDSTAMYIKNQNEALRSRITALETDLSAKESKRASLEGLLERFKTEILPLAYFAQASIYHKQYPDPQRFDEIQRILDRDFPESKYTRAIQSLRDGTPIRLIDPAEEAAERRLDYALSLAEAAPDSMVAILQELGESRFSDIRLRSNFRLGWYYGIEARDTTNARPFFEEVLKLQQTGDYKDTTQRLFNGTRFTFLDVKAAEDSLGEQADSLLLGETTPPDSLVQIPGEEAVSDTLADVTKTGAEADSLNWAKAVKALADSLFEVSDSTAAFELEDSTVVTDSLRSTPPESAPEKPEPGEIEPAPSPETSPEPLERKEEAPEPLGETEPAPPDSDPPSPTPNPPPE